MNKFNKAMRQARFIKKSTRKKQSIRTLLRHLKEALK